MHPLQVAFGILGILVPMLTLGGLLWRRGGAEQKVTASLGELKVGQDKLDAKVGKLDEKVDELREWRAASDVRLTNLADNRCCDHCGHTSYSER